MRGLAGHSVLLLVGVVYRVFPKLWREGRRAEERCLVLCVDLAALIRKSPANAASSWQLHCPTRFFIVVTSTMPFLSQVLGWEVSMCRRLGFMGGVFVACTLWVLPEVVR